MNLLNIPSCLVINGKTLTQPERNLLAKIQKDYGFDVTDTGLVDMPNRVTGIYCNGMNPLVAALVRFAYECYDNYENSGTYQMSYNGKKVAIGTYDRVRYLVLKLDNKAYNTLLD
jgi:hypothetical protein